MSSNYVFSSNNPHSLLFFINYNVFLCLIIICYNQVIAYSKEAEKDVLIELYEQEKNDEWIKMIVASNPSIGVDYFRQLIETSKDEYVQSGLAQNPLMSSEDLSIFLKKFKSSAAKIGVACKEIPL